MKYNLKNKELEASLNKFIPDFDKIFQRDCTEQYSDSFDYVLVYLVNSPIGNIKIKKSDIYKCPEYDSKTWNEFPEVTPPEGVIMRVEAGLNGDRRKIKTSAVFVNGVWCEPNIKSDPSVIGPWITRFRPWEDD